MKQLLILSGKGGTGKTTVASAFIKLSGAKAYADCDVDAPNLHLVMDRKTEVQQKDFFGLDKAMINQQMCIQCGLCKAHCRFDAIKDTLGYSVDRFACEGCGVCEALCPIGAVTLKSDKAGDLMLYVEDSVFSTAQLKMGSGTSGLLVTEVKKQMKTAAGPVDIAIIDGSPGIGCPVIASLSGVDMVLIVSEPSISGISDMKRIIHTAEKLGIKVAVCVNKFDTNQMNTSRIEDYCHINKLPFVGKIPYDPEAVRAINSGKSIVDRACISGNAVREVFNETMKNLLKEII